MHSKRHHWVYLHGQPSDEQSRVATPADLQMVALCHGSRILIYERILPLKGVRMQESKLQQGHSEMVAAKLVPTVRQQPTPAVYGTRGPMAKQGQVEEAVAKRTLESIMQQEQTVAAVKKQAPKVQTAVVTKMRESARQCEQVAGRATVLELTSREKEGAVAETVQTLTTQPEQTKVEEVRWASPLPAKVEEVRWASPVQQAAAAKLRALARVCEQWAAAVMERNPMSRQGKGIAAGVVPAPAIQQRPAERDAGRRQRSQTATKSPTVAQKVSSEV
jgi:hypothetical protein